MAYLDSNDAAGVRLRYELPAEEGLVVLLGSAEDATLRYESEGVAAHHATIIPAGGQFSIAPVEGAVLVNGAAITEPMLLVPGVDYALGTLHLSFSPESLPAAGEAETEETADEPAENAEEPARRKVRRRNRSAAAALAAASLEPSQGENPLITLITPFYVIGILIAAFVAGLSLRYWMLTGGFLPTDWLGE